MKTKVGLLHDTIKVGYIFSARVSPEMTLIPDRPFTAHGVRVHPEPRLGLTDGKRFSTFFD